MVKNSKLLKDAKKTNSTLVPFGPDGDRTAQNMQVNGPHSREKEKTKGEVLVPVAVAGLRA